MLNELRSARDEISMEAVAGDNENKAAERLPSFLEKAAEFLNKTVLQTIGNIFGTKDLSWLAMQAPRKNFSELRGIELRAPQGFKGSLVDYGNALIKAVEDSQDLCKDVLDPFGSWIGQKLADPESLRSLTNTLRIPGLQAIKVDELNKKLDHFFPEKSDDKAPIYGDLLRRQADWSELYQQSKKLNTLYANGKFEQIQKKVPELCQLLSVFGQRVNEYKEEFQFSSVTTDQLSKVTYSVAEQLEFVGVLRHRVDEFLKIVNENVELVKNEI